MKSVYILGENIRTLLELQHKSQHDLAFWCHHSDPWLSAILGGKREIQLADLDRVASFFGVAAYQLFQPGISTNSERRSGLDRRKARERRISAAQRNMIAVADEINRIRPRRTLPSMKPGKE